MSPVLVDGGYMDNTPIGPLRSNGIRNVIVVDVGAVDDTSPRNYGDSVSGWWIFLNKWVVTCLSFNLLTDIGSIHFMSERSCP